MDPVIIPFAAAINTGMVWVGMKLLDASVGVAHVEINMSLFGFRVVALPS